MHLPTKTIPAAKANFFGLIFETFFFGMFLLVFGISLHFQLKQRVSEKTFGNTVVFLFSILLFGFITTHWFLELWIVYDILLKVPLGLQQELAFNSYWTPKELAAITIYEIQVWMGDLVLIYRMYCVTGKRIVFVIPAAILSIATIVCSCNFLSHTAKASFTRMYEFTIMQEWTIGTFSCTIAQNLYCASLISWSIWQSHKRMNFATQSNLGPILRIFIESAAIWIIFMVAMFVAYLTGGTNDYLIAYYMTNPVLGIAFCLMTVRLHLHSQQSTKQYGGTSGSSGTYASGGSSGQTPRKLTFKPAAPAQSFGADTEMETDDMGRSVPLTPMAYAEKKDVEASFNAV